MREFLKSTENGENPRPGEGARQLANILGLPAPKIEDRPRPGAGARRLEDILNSPLSPERQAFEVHVDPVMQIRNLDRPAAERGAYEMVLVEILDSTHPNTPDNRCAHCRKLETPSDTLLPIGVGLRHAWLHSECWEPWRIQRRAAAEDALVRLGVTP